MKTVTFEEFESGKVKLTDERYIAVRNEWGYVIAYKGTETGQLLGAWFAEVGE